MTTMEQHISNTDHRPELKPLDPSDLPPKPSLPLWVAVKSWVLNTALLAPALLLTTSLIEKTRNPNHSIGADLTNGKTWGGNAILGGVLAALLVPRVYREAKAERTHHDLGKVQLTLRPTGMPTPEEPLPLAAKIFAKITAYGTAFVALLNPLMQLVDKERPPIKEIFKQQFSVRGLGYAVATGSVFGALGGVFVYRYASKHKERAERYQRLVREGKIEEPKMPSVSDVGKQYNHPHADHHSEVKEGKALASVETLASVAERLDHASAPAESKAAQVVTERATQEAATAAR